MMGRSFRGGLVALLVSCSNQTEIPVEPAQATVLLGAGNALERGSENTRRVGDSTGRVPTSYTLAVLGPYIVQADPLAQTIAERVILTHSERGTVVEVGAVLGAPTENWLANNASTRATPGWLPISDKRARYIVALGHEQTVVLETASGTPVLTFPLIAETCHFAEPNVVNCIDRTSKTVVVGDLETRRTWRFEGAVALHAFEDSPLGIWTDTEDRVHAFSPAFETHSNFGMGRLERVSPSGRFAFVRTGAKATIHDALGGSAVFADAFPEEGSTDVIFSDDEQDVVWTELRDVPTNEKVDGQILWKHTAKIHVFHVGTGERTTFDAFACSTEAERPKRLHAGILETDAACSLGCPSVRWAKRARFYDTVHGTLLRDDEEKEPGPSYNEQASVRTVFAETLETREGVARADIAMTEAGGAIVYGERNVRACHEDACVTLEDAAPNETFVFDAREAQVFGRVDGAAARWDAKTGVRIPWRS